MRKAFWVVVIPILFVFELFGISSTVDFNFIKTKWGKTAFEVRASETMENLIEKLEKDVITFRKELQTKPLIEQSDYWNEMFLWEAIEFMDNPDPNKLPKLVETWRKSFQMQNKYSAFRINNPKLFREQELAYGQEKLKRFKSKQDKWERVMLKIYKVLYDFYVSQEQFHRNNPSNVSEFDLNDYPILSKIENHKTPPIPENYPLLPLPEDIKNTEIYLNVRQNMLKEMIEEGDGYTREMKRCGDSSVLPTYAQQLISDIDYIIAEEWNVRLELSIDRESLILEAINYILEKSLWKGYGLRFWSNKKFLESLTEKEKENLVEEIVKYVKLYGVTDSKIDEKNKANNKKFINDFFDNLKKKNNTSNFYCNLSDSEIHNFSGVEKWEIIEDHASYKYKVRVYSKNIINQWKMEIFNIYINHDDLLTNCVYKHVCIKEIDVVPIQFFK